ncbi:hypothetical protein PP175_21190 [Aneurinibacillus sp. Ricciae_BoGa-3]|nr:hypothetical protein [Aneurinibacillus sp. Ricciae_BoGa-3]WCK53807.1 hypothetical protein PP175_21190 [Aneurinibacillus sp. Ricciae_BoGa-3]
MKVITLSTETEAVEYKGYDTNIIYDYKEQPDVVSGRCDNCGNAHFKSSVKDYVFLRECRKCGMKKSI